MQNRNSAWIFGYEEVLGILDDWAQMAKSDKVYLDPGYLKGRAAGIAQLKKQQLQDLVLNSPSE